MEIKTMVLDGIEYVLIPKDVFEKSIGIEQKEPETVVVNTETVQPAQSEEQPTIIVESVTGVRQAQGKNYEYKQRLDKHQLLPEDVMVMPKSFQPMEELPEIARNDFKSTNDPRFTKAKWGFYGPGAERDLG